MSMNVFGKNPMRLTGVVLSIVVFAVLPMIVGKYWLHVLVMVGISLILTVSLRLILLTGQLAFSQGGMMTVGAYTTAVLSTTLGWSPWLSLLAAPLVALVFALLVGYPLVRLKGIYFTLSTLFLSQVVIIVFREWKGITGGSWGIVDIPPPNAISLPGLGVIDFASKQTFYYFTLIAVLVVIAVCYSIERSRVGFAWNSIKESEDLAKSVGVNVNWMKVLAFSIGSLFAGLAGGLYAQYNMMVTPDAFGFVYTVYIVLYMVIGGTRYFSGPVVGTVVMMLLPELARPLKQYQSYLFAVVAVLVIYFLPDGLVSVPKRLIGLVRAKRNEICSKPRA